MNAPVGEMVYLLFGAMVYISSAYMNTPVGEMVYLLLVYGHNNLVCNV